MTWYLQLNLALLVFGLFAILLSYSEINSRQKIKAHYLLVVLVLLMLPAIVFFPEVSYEYPVHEALKSPVKTATEGIQFVHKAMSQSRLPKVIPYQSESILYFFYFVIVVLMCLIPWKVFATYREIRQAYCYKAIGNINLLISDQLQSPYAFSFLNKSYVVIPQFLLKDMAHFKLALKHEFQHIRNYDTSWVYVFELVLSICFLNPVIYLWRRQVLLDQEFACDESLIAHEKVPYQAYAKCLLQVAETVCPHNRPYGATGMAWGKMQSQLLRRIVKMKKIKREQKSFFNIIVLTSLMIFGLSAFALRTTVGKITMTELQGIVNVKDFGEFPIELNEQVLAELNRFHSNSKWKSFTRESLKRYQAYEGLISSTAKRYNLPKELAAVAFIESGFKSVPSRKTSISLKGAGIWQFIPSTARKYGLKVNKNNDERLNIGMATDAAMRYLGDNQLQLNDLRLALMGYYVGENRILKDIVKYGTRNPWTLIEKGKYQTPYLARVMAAAILIKYPSIVN